MLANFKGKQNTNWFARNTQNINKKWRPHDTISYITKENIRKWDYFAGIPETLEYIRKKWDKLSLRDLNSISRLCFARYWYMTGGDMKKYYRVMGIK